ncbi:MAG TPA: type II secretion system protein [Thermoanaerobaculia bacterium]
MPSKSGESGYNMVMLIVAVTILNIMVAAVLPLMSTDIQRQKEEELVFRGFQYAEAIRLFHGRFQRYPVKLEELLEMKPRCIRQLWKDPMTKDGKWGLIFQGGVTTPPPQNSTGSADPPPAGPSLGVQNLSGQTAGGQTPGGQEPDGTEGGLNTPKNGEVVATGPIIGVYSKSKKASHLILYGREHYNEWQFTENLLTGAVPSAGPQPRGGGRLAFSTRWLGRPMQFVDQAQPQDGTMPGQTGTGVGGQPGTGTTGRGTTGSGSSKKP